MCGVQVQATTSLDNVLFRWKQSHRELQRANQEGQPPSRLPLTWRALQDAVHWTKHLGIYNMRFIGLYRAGYIYIYYMYIGLLAYLYIQYTAAKKATIFSPNNHLRHDQDGCQHEHAWAPRSSDAWLRIVRMLWCVLLHWSWSVGFPMQTFTITEVDRLQVTASHARAEARGWRCCWVSKHGGVFMLLSNSRSKH